LNKLLRNSVFEHSDAIKEIHDDTIDAIENIIFTIPKKSQYISRSINKENKIVLGSSLLYAIINNFIIHYKLAIDLVKEFESEKGNSVLINFMNKIYETNINRNEVRFIKYNDYYVSNNIDNYNNSKNNNSFIYSLYDIIIFSRFLGLNFNVLKDDGSRLFHIDLNRDVGIKIFGEKQELRKIILKQKGLKFNLYVDINKTKELSEEEYEIFFPPKKPRRGQKIEKSRREQLGENIYPKIKKETRDEIYRSLGVTDFKDKYKYLSAIDKYIGSRLEDEVGDEILLESPEFKEISNRIQIDKLKRLFKQKRKEIYIQLMKNCIDRNDVQRDIRREYIGKKTDIQEEIYKYIESHGKYLNNDNFIERIIEHIENNYIKKIKLTSTIKKIISRKESDLLEEINKSNHLDKQQLDRTIDDFIKKIIDHNIGDLIKYSEEYEALITFDDQLSAQQRIKDIINIFFSEIYDHIMILKFSNDDIEKLKEKLTDDFIRVIKKELITGEDQDILDILDNDIKKYIDKKEFSFIVFRIKRFIEQEHERLALTEDNLQEEIIKFVKSRIIKPKDLLHLFDKCLDELVEDIICANPDLNTGDLSILGGNILARAKIFIEDNLLSLLSTDIREFLMGLNSHIKLELLTKCQILKELFDNMKVDILNEYKSELLERFNAKNTLDIEYKIKYIEREIRYIERGDISLFQKEIYKYIDKEDKELNKDNLKSKVIKFIRKSLLNISEMIRTNISYIETLVNHIRRYSADDKIRKLSKHKLKKQLEESIETLIKYENQLIIPANNPDIYSLDLYNKICLKYNVDITSNQIKYLSLM